MDTARRNKMMIRWSIATAAVIALFWGIWYLVAGSVPVVHEIKMTKGWIIILPFGISRWWDVLIGPMWSVVVILIFANKTVKENNNLTFGLAFGLIAGLIAGLAFGLTFGLVAGLIAGLTFGLAFGLGFGLAAGLTFGLAFGLTFGLVAGLIAGLTFGLVFGLIYVTKKIKPAVGNWLMAR